MTPVAVLVGFCAVMTAIAIGRLTGADTRDRVDIGSTLVVLGLTLLSASWAAVDGSRLSLPAQLLLAAIGAGTVSAGIVVIVRYWNDSGESPASDS